MRVRKSKRKGWVLHLPIQKDVIPLVTRDKFTSHEEMELRGWRMLADIPECRGMTVKDAQGHYLWMDEDLVEYVVKEFRGG